MKNASRWWVALSLALTCFLAPREAAATPVCYQATDVTGEHFLGPITVIPANCSTTPDLHGWTQIDAPYELYLAVPYAWNLYDAHYIYYAGEVNGAPSLELWLIVGTGGEPFPLDPTPPGQQYLCQVPGDHEVVPAMTSNTAPSGTVSSSGNYSSSYLPWKAFDGTTASGWLSNENTSSVWLQYEWGGGALKLVKSYQVKYANGSCCQQRGPKNWTLQGWNGAAWITIDTVTNQTGWYSNPNRTYTVDNPGAYSKVRLFVTADNYNNPSHSITLVSIAELQIDGQNAIVTVPDMTGNGLPSGSVTRSGVYGSTYEAWQAFDQSTATSWLSNGNATSVWVAYEWGGSAQKVVNSYQIKYANGSCCEQRGPKSWTLQGWNGSTWTTIDSVTGQSGWYSSSIRTFGVDSPGCYQAYRLLVSADNYNSATYPVTLVSIAELQLFSDAP